MSHELADLNRAKNFTYSSQPINLLMVLGELYHCQNTHSYLTIQKKKLENKC